MRREGEERQWPSTTKGSGGWRRRSICGIPSLAEPKPLARWSSALAGQPEREKSEGKVAKHPLQAAAIACRHPEHQLPPDPVAKGRRYQRCSSSPEKSQGLSTLYQRRAGHSLAGAALITHLHQPTSRGAEPGGEGPGPRLLRGLAIAQGRMGRQCLSLGKTLLAITTQPSIRRVLCQPAQAPSRAPVPTSPSTSRSSNSSSSSDTKHHDSMEEGVPVGNGPLARRRTLVPPSTIPSPGANCDSATIPFASSLGTASPSPSAGAGYRSPSPCCTGAPGCSLCLPKAMKQQRVPVMGNTHIWILPQQDGLRERERAGSGGKTERTEQEWVHLSRISNSTQKRGHGWAQPQEHLPGTIAGHGMLKMGGGVGEGEVCWV